MAPKRTKCVHQTKEERDTTAENVRKMFGLNTLGSDATSAASATEPSRPSRLDAAAVPESSSSSSVSTTSSYSDSSDSEDIADKKPQSGTNAQFV